MTAKSLLLTFRLDQEQRQRLKARLAREGRTMSEVVTPGLRQYVRRASVPAPVSAVAAAPPAGAAGEAGGPVRPLAEALGISKQAGQRRIGHRIPAELPGRVANPEPPPPFP